jgi:siroheme synthase (precorrin-2 oxidase/ferrochelatase)
MSEIRKRIKNPAPDGWEQVAAAMREVRDQIRESFGPRQEVRLVTDELCGFVDGGEVTADGSANNDLAHERADAVMKHAGAGA